MSSSRVTESIANAATEFPLTHWSAVFAVGRDGDSRAEAALTELCQTYWYPLYAFARRKGHAPHDAQDLTQGFFEHLISTRLVEKANPQKGRFRSFLLACFSNFLTSEQDRAQAKKRGGGRSVVALDRTVAENRLAREPALDGSPDFLFDRNWALAVLEAGLQRLEAEFRESGRAEVLEHLQPFLQGDTSGPSYTEVARRLGTTEGTISVSVHRLRKRYRELLRAVVSQTVNNPLDTDAELAHLLAALRKSP